MHRSSALCLPGRRGESLLPSKRILLSGFTIHRTQILINLSRCVQTDLSLNRFDNQHSAMEKEQRRQIRALRADWRPGRCGQLGYSEKLSKGKPPLGQPSPHSLPTKTGSGQRSSERPRLTVPKPVSVTSNTGSLLKSSVLSLTLSFLTCQ